MMCVAACDGEMKRKEGRELRGREELRGEMRGRRLRVKVVYAVLTLYWGSPRLESQ